MKKTGRMDGGAGFEPIRKWDKNHPDKAIGTYADPVEGGPTIDKDLVEKNAKVQVSDEEVAAMEADLAVEPEHTAGDDQQENN